MGIEVKALSHILDALGSSPLMRLQFAQKQPGVGMVGIDAQRRRQFHSAFIRLTFEMQHKAENCVCASISRVKRRRALGCCERKRTMGLNGFSPPLPGGQVAHREPGMRVREARVEFD